MDIKGKITIFPKKLEVEDGNVKTIFNGTISTKLKDENENEYRLNKSVEVRFASKKFPEEKLNALDENYCYSLDIVNGFLGVKEVKNGRDIYIMVTDGTLKDRKLVEKKPEAPKNYDLPF